MEQRRFTLFIVLSSMVLFGWMFLGPMLFPDLFPKPKPAGNDPAVAEAPAEQQDPLAEGGEERAPDGDGPPREVTEVNPPEGQDPGPAEVDPVAELPEFPSRTVVLGSMDGESGYFMEVELISRGAAVQTITLNDERYIAEARRGAPVEQLKIVGNNLNTQRRTLDIRIARIDEILEQHGTSLAEVDWEVDQNFLDDHTDDDTGIVDAVQFRYRSPDGQLDVFKTYEMHLSDPTRRDEDANGYLIDFTLRIENLTAEEQAAQYELTGPVGLPLENVENTRTFIELKVGIANDPDDPSLVTETDRITAAGVVDEKDEPNPADRTVWRGPMRYIGGDVQFFAALLAPGGDQQVDLDGDGEADPYFVESIPVLVNEHPDNEERSDVSVSMTSRELTIAPNEEIVHQFQFFAGPKRAELLDSINADGVIDYGWFGWISVWMVLALRFFHEFLLLPYGLAIVFLTLIVRACMFPITRKQAKGAKKMKELQPELTKLKEKYGKEPEKFWQAQRDLFRKHNYHPLAGCLPLFLQMPIFFGLYRALNVAVDLRMVPFLWIENLAAPDALFELPFVVPFLGWTEFNILPFVTISLWIVQQKMFMPPAATEEAALQQKMMTYMMLFFGFMIYRVPAGLCVYFITSTLWGLTERKMLDWAKPEEEKKKDASSGDDDESFGPRDPVAPDEPKPPGFFQRLLDAADEARNQTNGQNQPQPPSERSNTGRKKGGGGKRKKSRR